MSDEQKKDGSDPLIGPQSEKVKLGEISPQESSAPAAAASQADKTGADTAALAEPTAAVTDSSAAAPVDEEQEAKAKADAEARAARAIARAKRLEGKAAADVPAVAEPTSASAAASVSPAAASADDDKEAKAKAAAEARAARANARGKKPEDEEDGAPKIPSPLQPRLDHWVKLIKEQVGDDAIEEAFINERDAHLPYIVIKNEQWAGVALLLKQHCELKFNYLRNVSGIDQETHMEVAYHLLALDTKYEVCIKVKTSRETPSIASVAPFWPTADWNEREIYDLLGIDFPGHPDLRRIMMSDDWVGHPLRKDYEALDPEV